MEDIVMRCVTEFSGFPLKVHFFFIKFQETSPDFHWRSYHPT